MEMYLKQQVEKADPIDFLRLSQGHDLVKLNICKQQTLLSDITTNIDVSTDSIHLRYDSDNLKQVSLEDATNEKQQIIDQTKGTITDGLQTEFRKRIMTNNHLGDVGRQYSPPKKVNFNSTPLNRSKNIEGIFEQDPKSRDLERNMEKMYSII